VTHGLPQAKTQIQKSDSIPAEAIAALPKPNIPAVQESELLSEKFRSVKS